MGEIVQNDPFFQKKSKKMQKKLNLDWHLFK